MTERIFVTIPSYCDPDLANTVKSLFRKADDPSRVRASIFEQEDVNTRLYMKECYDWNIDIERIHYTDAQGAGYARAQAQKAYDGEEYHYQIDSHSRFKQGWDTKMIEMHKSIDKDKVVLSQHPLPMIPDGDGYKVVLKHPKLWNYPSYPSAVWSRTHRCWTARRNKMPLHKPHEAYTVLAGNLFTTGNFIEEVPYDPDIAWMGEELCLAARAYTRGWSIYAPNECYIYHFYKRPAEKKLWTKDRIGIKKFSWHSLEMRTHESVEKVLAGQTTGEFGVKKGDRWEAFQETYRK